MKAADTSHLALLNCYFGQKKKRLHPQTSVQKLYFSMCSLYYYSVYQYFRNISLSHQYLLQM